MATNPKLQTATASILDLMPAVLETKPTWTDMMDVFARVMDTNVESQITQLEGIRSLNQDSDIRLLTSTARLLGFDLTQDVLNLNADNLTKIVSQLALYPDQNGTELFIKFIDLVLNSITSIQYLWTVDYLNFYPEPGGPTIAEGGSWFKTTHIDIDVTLLSLESLVLSSGQTLIGRVTELFYGLAPVALVIERISLSEVFADRDWLGGAAFGIGAVVAYSEATVIID